MEKKLMKLSKLNFKPVFPKTFLVLILFSTFIHASGPKPGDIYKEFKTNLKTGRNWRVTDPQASEYRKGPEKFLPNPVLNINIDDLERAVKAEVLIDRWGGHPGTVDKKIRFNENAWIDLPELTTTPEGHKPQCYMYQDNPVVEIPLKHLKEGYNSFEGICGNQICHSFNWGQWGWYGVIVRIYYDSSKQHPTGKIIFPVSGDTLKENPIITARAADAEGGYGIDRIDFLAYCESYDENGDGIYLDWHHHYHNTSIGQHVGTAIGATYQDSPCRVIWDTRWVPDQKEGTVKLIARIQNHKGIWFVTEPVENLSFVREKSSVKLYKPLEVPERFWVRDNRKYSCKINIPENHDLSTFTETFLHIRTWNGYNHGIGTPIRINEWHGLIAGADHNFSYTIQEIPISAIKNGDNVIEFYSETEHHGVEILWPGPALTVRYSVSK